MKIKGLEKFFSKIPDYREGKLYIIPVVTIISFLLAIFLMILIDILPTLFPTNSFLGIIEPLLPIVSTLVFQYSGIFLISRIWIKKEKYLEKYEDKAYQKALIYVITGIPIFVASMLHGFIPLNLIYNTPENLITWIMARPITLFIFNLGDPFALIRHIFGFLILIIGIGTIFRSLFTFGLDYMSILYVYYPEESEIQDNEIYSILRHPAYHGIILISFSSILFRFSIYSLLISLLFILGMNIHIKLVEEKELLERFDDSYRDYMEDTNALFFNPRFLGKFFKFLFGKK